MVKVSSSFTHPPQNDGLLDFLWNWTETTFQWLIFPNFTSIRHLVSLNCIIWAKVCWLIEYSSYEKALFTITGLSNIQLLKFWLFNFSNFQTTFVKNFLEKLPGLKIYFESTDKVLPLHQYLWSGISWQQNNGPLNFLWKLRGRVFCFLNFVEWKKY